MSTSMASSTSTYSTTILKQQKSVRVGVLFKNGKEGVRVAEISPDGIAVQSDLSVGDKILSINGNEVSDLSAKETAKYLRSTSGLVEIVAESRDDAPTVKVISSVESTPLLISSNTMGGSLSSLEKKSWKWEDSFQDHCRVLVHLPLIIFAPLLLTPKESIAVLLSGNSINGCIYCSNLYNELGRMSGVTKEAGLAEDEENQGLDIFSDFGRTFAESNGYGIDVRDSYDKVVAEKGGMAGLTAEAQGYFMLWTSLTGNTINSFLEGTLRGNTREGSNATFETIFTLYYGPLFLCISILSFLLKIFPSNLPSVVNKFFGIALALVASIWIIPYSFLGIVMLPFITGTRSIMDGAVGGYLA